MAGGVRLFAGRSGRVDGGLGLAGGRQGGHRPAHRAGDRPGSGLISQLGPDMPRRRAPETSAGAWPASLGSELVRRRALCGFRPSREEALGGCTVDGNLPDRPRCPCSPTVGQLNRQTARPATRRAIGSQQLPRLRVDRLCGPPLTTLPSRAAPWLQAQSATTSRSPRFAVECVACGRVVTPAASLAFLWCVGGRVRVLPCAPAVGRPSTPETGPDGAPRPGPGYDPGAPLTRGRSVLRGRCCLG